jgi:hypothetical protein
MPGHLSISSSITVAWFLVKFGSGGQHLLLYDEYYFGLMSEVADHCLDQSLAGKGLFIFFVCFFLSFFPPFLFVSLIIALYESQNVGDTATQNS